MVDHKVRLMLKRLFNAVPGAKDEFERIVGMDLDKLPHWMVEGGIKTAVDTEKLHREEERDRKIREEQREFYARIEHAKAQALRYSLNEAAKIIRDGNKEDAQRLEQILTSVKEGYQMLESSKNSAQQEQKYLPLPHLDYSDCWRKHPANEDFPGGRPGPSQCIQTIPNHDGIHYRCLVAYVSHNPGDEGFARLEHQIFHAELLREGDCPKPLSRSITRRIPGVSWVFVKKDKCPLADGGEYVLKKGGKLERIGD